MAKSTISTGFFGNVIMLSPEGIVMCRLSTSNADWYVRQSLAKEVDAEARTIQLLFNPKGLGFSNNPYYLQEFQNYCVVCKSKKKLTKHHVVPMCFLKYFPFIIKKAFFHDCLMLCKKCHQKVYEDEATKLKIKLCEEANVKFGDNGGDFDVHKHALIKFAGVILKHRDKLPPQRLKQMYTNLSWHFNRQPTDEELKILANESAWTFNQRPSFGEVVVKKFGFRSLTLLWRQHFLDVMKPQHLPDLWDVNHEYEWIERN